MKKKILAREVIIFFAMILLVAFIYVVFYSINFYNNKKLESSIINLDGINLSINEFSECGFDELYSRIDSIDIILITMSSSFKNSSVKTYPNDIDYDSIYFVVQDYFRDFNEYNDFTYPIRLIKGNLRHLKGNGLDKKIVGDFIFNKNNIKSFKESISNDIYLSHYYSKLEVFIHKYGSYDSFIEDLRNLEISKMKYQNEISFFKNKLYSQNEIRYLMYQIIFFTIFVLYVLRFSYYAITWAIRTIRIGDKSSR